MRRSERELRAADEAGGGPGATAASAAREERVIGFGDVFGRDAGGLIVLLVLFGALTIASDEFLTGNNLANLARQVAIFGIIAVGQLLVILTAGIDLSVGSVLGLAGAITAELLVHGAGIPLAILGGLAVGGLCGVINGVLVSAAKLPPFIATLGMLGIARGVVLVLTDASTVQPLPASFADIANGSLLGLPNLLWMFFVVAAVVAFVLRRTVFGRYIYAVGSNPESARLAGVPVKRVLIGVYAISGLLAGVGGVLLTSRLNAGVPTAGTGYELNAIAACVIGGASLFGAKGGAFGAAAGALIVATLNNGGNLLAINSFYLQIIIGALILAAVAFDQLQGRSAGRPLRVILAHDLGTTGDKAALYSPEGALVAATTARYGTDYGPGGHVEQDAGDWWQATATATRSLLEQTGVRADEVACVSFSGQMMGALLLDAHGEPVRPAIIWADTRSAEQCDRLVERVGMEAGYRLIGHRLNPTYSLTKVMWVREHEPEAFARTRHIVLAKDYIAFRLTGVLATDPSDASSTNAFDQRAGAWSDDLLAAAEIDRALLPEIVPSTTVLGAGDRRGRARDRARRRDAGRARRRRRAVRGARRRRDLRGLGRLRLPRVVVVGVDGGRRAAARPADADDDVQPCAAGRLRADRDHAGGRRLDGVDLRGARRAPRRARRRRGGRGGRARRPALPPPPARRALAVLEPERPRSVRRPAAPSRPRAPRPAPCSRGSR